MIWVAAVLACILTGSLVYCVLVLLAVRSYKSRTGLQACSFPPISVLKPLSGRDLGLEDNLRSFFTQDYPNFELLFAVRHTDDPAVEVVRQLEAEFPHVTSYLITTADPPYPTAKLFRPHPILPESPPTPAL